MIADFYERKDRIIEFYEVNRMENDRDEFLKELSTTIFPHEVLTAHEFYQLGIVEKRGNHVTLL